MLFKYFLAAAAITSTALAAPTRLPPSPGDVKRDMPYPKIFPRNGTAPSPGGYVPLGENAVQLIESEEGFSSNYYDIDGDETIGYGHDCTQRQDCSGINAPISQEEGEKLLLSDLGDYAPCVCKLPNASGLNQNQYGALTSFAYNAGCGGLEDAFTSYLSDSDYSGACNALPNTYTNDGELSSRRQREADLCNTATSTPSGC